MKDAFKFAMKFKNDFNQIDSSELLEIEGENKRKLKSQFLGTFLTIIISVVSFFLIVYQSY